MSLESFRRLLHWGPISVLCIIKLISWAMIHVMSMWWPPHSSLAGALHTLMFLGLAASTMYFFLQALLEGPGYVPLGWRPENEEDTQYLQYCAVCRGFKAPRSHHCRKCGHCIKKMDHHCPWINCCVGHNNHGYFTYFLMCAVLGCLHASIVLPICVYHALNRIYYIQSRQGPIVILTLTPLLLTLLAIGMAIGVVLAVSALLFFQLRGIYRNQTTIEEWIIEKAISRRAEQNLPPFQFPYDVGWRKHFREVLGGGGDGLKWEVRKGCGEYDLTVEQLSQKSAKLSRSAIFVATHPYNGAKFRFSTKAMCAPCGDNTLCLNKGDYVRATRQKRNWLFGEKLTQTEGERGDRGWFPKQVAVLAQSVNQKVKPD